MMKPPFRLRLGYAVFVASLTSLLTPMGQADPVEDAVADIRARYNLIEGAKLRSSQVEFESNEEPVAGSCVRYYQGDQLVKVHLSYAMGDHGGGDEYFYYQNGELFFAYATDSYWGFTGGTLPNGESETIDTAVEHRTYFVDGALIRHLFKEVKSKTPENIAALLSKAPNQPCDDGERAARLYRFGSGAFLVKTASDLGALLTAEE